MRVEAVLITSRVIIKVPETGLICFFPQENLKNQGKVLPQNLLKNFSRIRPREILRTDNSDYMANDDFCASILPLKVRTWWRETVTDIMLRSKKRHGRRKAPSTSVSIDLLVRRQQQNC